MPFFIGRPKRCPHHSARKNRPRRRYLLQPIRQKSRPDTRARPRTILETHRAPRPSARRPDEYAATRSSAAQTSCSPSVCRFSTFFPRPLRVSQAGYLNREPPRLVVTDSMSPATGTLVTIAVSASPNPRSSSANPTTLVAIRSAQLEPGSRRWRRGLRHVTWDLAVR